MKAQLFSVIKRLTGLYFMSTLRTVIHTKYETKLKKVVLLLFIVLHFIAEHFKNTRSQITRENVFMIIGDARNKRDSKQMLHISLNFQIMVR